MKVLHTEGMSVMSQCIRLLWLVLIFDIVTSISETTTTVPLTIANDTANKTNATKPGGGVASDATSANATKECDIKKTPDKCPTKKAAKIPKTASFQEWTKWSTLFPMCSPENNPFLGPIKIDTKKAIPIQEQTLIVYSGDPVDVYTYSSLYKIEDDGVGIEALNIGLRNKEVYRDATYIAGLGNPEYRFFQRAMILFTKEAITEPERSLHQIDGKKFPMEIVFYFEDLQKTDQTQIHVLFEISDIGSPAWFWNGDATAQLNQLLDTVGTDNDMKDLQEATQKHLKAKKELDKMLKAERRETKEISGGYEMTFRDLELLHKLVSSAEDTKKQITKQKEISKKIEATKAIEKDIQDDIPKMEEKLQLALDEVDRQRRTGELQRGQENAATDLVADLKEKKAGLLKTYTTTHNKVRAYEEKKHDLDKEINIKNALLKKYKIGKGKGSQFKSVKDVANKKKAMQAKVKALTDLQELESSLKNEVETKGAMEPRDVIIPQKFQISWLFPDIGGYYRYNGSGVVPPCKKRTHVIVMENSVQLLNVVFNEFIAKIHKGRKQADIDSFDGDPLTDLPKIDQAIPILRELGNRTVWYNRKNLQYKLDDGWHMKSSLRRKLKDQMKQATGPPRAYPFDMVNLLILIAVILYFV